MIALIIFAIAIAAEPESVYEVNQHRDPDFKGLNYDPTLFNSFPDNVIWKNLDQDSPSYV